jgi:energy-coupling factor transporter ATP-binding protein EcfA2
MAIRPKKLFLTDEVKLPARNARDVQAACDPGFDLEGKDLLLLREDLSIVRSDRVRRIEECIRDARAGHYRLQLFSGHIGSGKTTELRWLAGELQKKKEDQVFHAVFLDVEQYLDARDVQIPELLTAMVSALIDDPAIGPHVRTSATAKKVWNEVVRWLKQIGVEVEGEIPAGVAKLKLSFKTSPGLQERYREENRKHVTSLIEWLGDLLQEARSALVKQGVEDLVVLVDKLDRIERLPLDDKSGRTRHDLFYLEQLPNLQYIPAHFVVTIPVTLHFTQGRLHQVFHGATDTILPMVAVHERGSDKPHEPGMAALTRLLRRRIDTSVVFADEDALRYAIEQSGGSLRDLFRIVTTGALDKRELKLTRADVDDVVKELGSHLERLLQGRPYLRELHHVAKTGSFPEKFDDATKQWLLYQLVVLEYNGDTWYDVHPFARRTRAFRDAAAATPQPPPVPPQPPA